MEPTQSQPEHAEALRALRAEIYATCKPRPRVSVIDWARSNRMLKMAGRPGPYDPSITPWMAEIYAQLDPDSPTEVVAVMKCQQSGLTELGLSWIGYCLDVDPGPMLAVQPTMEDYKFFAQTRVAELLRETPALAAKRASMGPYAADSVSVIEMPGSILRIGNAGSKGTLSSMPVRYVYLDEVSAYPQDVQGRGDPVEMARGRTTTFKHRRKILLTSTPEVDGCPMTRAFLAGDRREYWVPCPNCGVYQVLRMEGLRETGYECEGCGVVIDERRHKTAMLAAGEWRPSNPEGQYPSYHVSGFLRPLAWDGWDTIWSAFARSDTPEQRKSATNLQLGLPWKPEEKHALAPSALAERAETYSAEVPSDVVLLTAGVDVQGDRLEALIYGWGVGYEWWLIDRRIIRGSIDRPETRAELEATLRHEYTHEALGRIHIAAACIDSGHKTQSVYEFVAQHLSRRWYAVKGREGGDKYVWPPKATTKRHAAGYSYLYSIGVDAAKDTLLEWVAVDRPGPRYLHLPDWVPVSGYCDQMLSEYRTIERYGRGKVRVRFAQRHGVRNEALDCTVYAYAALKSIEADGLTLDAVLASQSDLRQSTTTRRAPMVPPREKRRPERFGAAQARAWGRV